MRQTGNRTITVNKEELINIIKENKKNHIAEYKEAVRAYKHEATKGIRGLIDSLNKGVKDAAKELEKYQKKVDKGSLDVTFNIPLPEMYLNLVTPVNASDNYDKIVKMFEMEVSEEVELTQNEFNEYVHDETQFAVQASMSNSTYLMQG